MNYNKLSKRFHLHRIEMNCQTSNEVGAWLGSYTAPKLWVGIRTIESRINDIICSHCLREL
jgi:hypothetical protein